MKQPCRRATLVTLVAAFTALSACSSSSDRSDETDGGTTLPGDRDVARSANTTDAGSLLRSPESPGESGLSEAGPVDMLRDGSLVPADGRADSPAQPVEMQTEGGRVPLNDAANPSCTHRVSLRADGTVLVDCNPVFPVGFYDVSWGSSLAEMTARLHLMADAGFNLVHASCSNLSDYGKYLDEAARVGVYVVTEGCNDQWQAVKAFKNKPAVLGWNIADDAGKHADAATVNRQREAVRALDPDHLTYISIALLKDLPGYAGTADLVGEQDYPVGQGSPLGEVYYVSSKLRAETHPYAGSAIPNLQSFAWTGQRWPTAAELDNMTYQAIAAQANGVLYYTYFDSGNRLADHPDLWNAAKRLGSELGRLAPTLLGGTYGSLPTGSSDVFAARWDDSGRVIIVVVNVASSSRQVAFSPGTATALRSISSDRPATLSLANGKLTGAMGALDVQLYEGN